MNKFQLEECLQKQKEWYIHHPEALKKLVSEADYSNNFTVIDNYFAVIYQDTIDVFPKEKLNDYLLKKGCLVCDLETAKDYKKFHKVYSVSNEKWVRDYFDLV